MAINSNGSLLQVAYGGYLLSSPFTVNKQELVYSEPGFTTINPIEFAIPKVDQFYLIIRKRNNIYGTSFENLDIANLLISVKDVTLGSSIPFDTFNFSSSSSYYSSKWEDGISDSKKVILAVDSGIPVSEPANRIRIIDINIKDRRDDSTLFFRVLVDDYDKTFHFLSVRSNEVSQRQSFSTAGSSITRKIRGKSDSYILLSPFAQFYEVDQKDSDFSYPLNTIFYKRQNTFNKEGFYYNISSYSHEALIPNIRISNIPSYPQMGVITMDKNLYNVVSSVTGNKFVEIQVRGIISEMTDIFKLNFIKA